MRNEDFLNFISLHKYEKQRKGICKRLIHNRSNFLLRILHLGLKNVKIEFFCSTSIFFFLFVALLANTSVLGLFFVACDAGVVLVEEEEDTESLGVVFFSFSLSKERRMCLCKPISILPKSIESSIGA